MGRTEKSQGLAPPAIRKDMRAKQARHIINKTVPALLASNSRARKGSESSELIANPPAITSIRKETTSKIEDVGGGDDVAYMKRKGQGRRKAKNGTRNGNVDEEIITRAGHERDINNRSKGKSTKRQDSLDETMSSLALSSSNTANQQHSNTNNTTPTRIRIITTDTLTASHMLTFPHKYPAHQPSSSCKPPKKAPNTCILNMASPLRPGGGVLTGATSQEEFLCARTTLLPSLKESFYRLPEIGGIYTPDVLVFRNATPLGNSAGELGPGERYYVDVVSAGMLRFPELEGGNGDGQGEVKRLGKRDRDVVEGKMRAVLRIAVGKGVKKLVLGAWGCGAYGNPVGDIARAWCKVLGKESTTITKKGKGTEVLERWGGLEEVVFAITNEKMAREFATAFGTGVEVEAGPGGSTHDDEEEDEEDEVAEELRAKIQEMESQLSKVWNPDLKTRMGVILDGLKVQLREREGGGVGAEDGEDDDEEEGDTDGESSADEDTPYDQCEIEDHQHLSNASDSVDGAYDTDEDVVIVSSKPLLR